MRSIHRAPGRPGTRLGRTATIGALSALLAVAILPTAPVVAQPQDTDDLGTASDHGVSAPDSSTAVDETTGLWFVELEGEPTARGGQERALSAQKQRFRAETADLGVDIEERFSYSSLWNGVSVRASGSDIAALQQVGDVAAVYPVVTVDAPDPGDSIVPDMESALGMTGADIAQSELGLDGTGIKVGIVDTGIDTDHPDFGGSGTNGTTAFPSEKIPFGYDFVGDDYNADASSPDYDPVPNPDPNPDDCQGHGTHVAGIVGADGDTTQDGVRGVAPGVELGAYRVFGCAGSTTSDIIVAALERAHADGMDVVNQSLGAAFATWPEYPTAAASDALVDAGVVVVASIGNSGTSGTWSAGAPGVGNKVIGVASYDNVETTSNAFRVSPDGRLIPYSPAAGALGTPTEGSLPMSRTGTPASTADACTATGELPANIEGTATLIQRGSCTFYEKSINAERAGAAAVVIYNNVPGGLSPTVAPPSANDPPVTIPVVAVTQADGLLLDSRIAAGPTTLTWTDEEVTVENLTGGLISSFSSYGMTADLQLKPDIGAPGGLIRSTYPLEQGGYATISGTSMSSPHVAGAVALLLEAEPDTETEDVRDILQNHADPTVWSLVPALGLLEPVHRQGAGMLDIDDAILADTSVTPGKLSLGESEAGPATRTLTVTNSGDAAVTYDLSKVDAISTGGNTNVPSFFAGGSSVDFRAGSVTVGAGETAELDVVITAPAGPNLSQYGGYLVMTPQGGGDPLRVPFAGFVGDYQDIVALTPTVNDLPELASLTACERRVGLSCTMGAEYDLERDGATYTMQGNDIPFFLVHLEHPVRNMTFTVHEANDDGSAGREVHRLYSTAFEVDYVGRSGTANGFTAYGWDGTVSLTERHNRNRTLRNGEYVMRLTVLKALGDPSNADHVETWDSPVITIDRTRGVRPVRPGRP